MPRRPAPPLLAAEVLAFGHDDSAGLRLSGAAERTGGSPHQQLGVLMGERHGARDGAAQGDEFLLGGARMVDMLVKNAPRDGLGVMLRRCGLGVTEQCAERSAFPAGDNVAAAAERGGDQSADAPDARVAGGAAKGVVIGAER